MAIHFGIITDFLNSKNDPAFFDIVTEGSAAVRYIVYQPATGDRTIVVNFSNQFATSPDLFNVLVSPVSLPALVSAETIDATGRSDGVTSGSMVRQGRAI